MQLCGSLNILWHCFSLGLEWKLTLSIPVATAEFSRFAGILSAALFTESSFMIWNSSSGIPSLPLALFIVMLPKAHLTSDSRMSGFRWVITLTPHNLTPHNLRYADDITLMEESKKELKSLLLKAKQESEKVGSKLNIQKTKIMASSPVSSWQIDGETKQTVSDFIFLGSKNHCRWWLQPWN